MQRRRNIIWSLPDLNDAFEQQLTLEDMGYESGSESLSVPTALHREP